MQQKSKLNNILFICLNQIRYLLAPVSLNTKAD